MNTCSDCKHFEPRTENTGNCGRWIASYQVYGDKIPAHEVVVECDEGWGAEMHKYFGCVLWEPVDSVPNNTR